MISRGHAECANGDEDGDRLRLRRRLGERERRDARARCRRVARPRRATENHSRDAERAEDLADPRSRDAALLPRVKIHVQGERAERDRERERLLVGARDGSRTRARGEVVRGGDGGEETSRGGTRRDALRTTTPRSATKTMRVKTEDAEELEIEYSVKVPEARLAELKERRRRQLEARARGGEGEREGGEGRRDALESRDEREGGARGGARAARRRAETEPEPGGGRARRRRTRGETPETIDARVSRNAAGVSRRGGRSRAMSFCLRFDQVG